MFKNRLSKEVEHLFSSSPDISDKQFSFNQIKGLLPEMFRKVGCADIEETAHYMTVNGTLSLYRARKPE